MYKHIKDEFLLIHIDLLLTANTVVMTVSVAYKSTGLIFLYSVFFINLI